MTRSFATTMMLFALVLAPVAPARAQFPDYDFADTGCVAERNVLRSGFEDAEVGPAPGNRTVTVSVSVTGRTHEALLYLPTGYARDRDWPLLTALHGAAGSAAAAPFAADAVRSLWSNVAEREGVIVLAPIASGSQGGWVPSVDLPAIACLIEAVARKYRVDLSRRYLWGFSAGAHFSHALALGNASRFAAYSIKAGALYALVCDPPGDIHPCLTTLPQVPRRLPVQLRVGWGDPLLPYVEGDAARFQVAGWSPGTNLAYAEIDGGHELDVSDVEAAWTFLAGFQLP